MCLLKEEINEMKKEGDIMITEEKSYSAEIAEVE